MALLDTVKVNLLEALADIREAPSGAYNIRVDGCSAGCANSEHVTITPKPDGMGLEIRVAPGTQGEKVYIPVVVGRSGLVETVYNDFYIGEEADVEVVAGCGIHNDGAARSQHDGIHTFYLARNARVVYVERHLGEGEGSGERVLNPVTDLHLGPGSRMEMETVQLRGVDSTRRLTQAVLDEDATLIVREKLMTHGQQFAETRFRVDLNGAGSKTHLISRSVAKEDSSQTFLATLNGNNRCMGHSECDAIIMDRGCVRSVPEVTANHVDASLIHEAAIGKIAGEQIIKLMTLGLTEAEAEALIVNGFLR